MGAKVSSKEKGKPRGARTTVGSTKFPGRSSTLPPRRTFPPSFRMRASAAAKASTASRSMSGPQRVPGSRGSPMTMRP